MRADGSEPVRLTRNGRSNHSPTWSPTGEQIAFVSQAATVANNLAASHLYVMDWDGAELVDVTPSLDLSISSPVWSPDGRHLAFVAIAPSAEDAFPGANVFVVDPDGANLIQITQMRPGSVGCQSPAWSPDSTQVAFVCRALMVVGVQIARVDGTGQWGTDFLGQVGRLFWLPSGATMAFTNGQCLIGVFNAQYLLERGAVDFGPWPCLDIDLDALGLDAHGPLEVVWSPVADARFVVQLENRLQLVDMADYALNTIETQSGRLLGPASWSSDGQRLVYALDNGSGAEIYALTLEGNEISQLTQNTADDSMPAWQP
jgi:Tol biopolymer transport system component